MTAGWLDRLPAAARHSILTMIVAPATGFVGVFLLAIAQAKGVHGVDWVSTLSTAEDTAGITFGSGATAMIAMYITPLTNQYGLSVGAPASTSSAAADQITALFSPPAEPASTTPPPTSAAQDVPPASA